ncbi:uncharacterized protein M6D78_002908 [Vipera latastei]
MFRLDLAFLSTYRVLTKDHPVSLPEGQDFVEAGPTEESVDFELAVHFTEEESSSLGPAPKAFYKEILQDGREKGRFLGGLENSLTPSSLWQPLRYWNSAIMSPLALLFIKLKITSLEPRSRKRRSNQAALNWRQPTKHKGRVGKDW